MGQKDYFGVPRRLTKGSMDVTSREGTPISYIINESSCPSSRRLDRLEPYPSFAYFHASLSMPVCPFPA